MAKKREKKVLEGTGKVLSGFSRVLTVIVSLLLLIAGLAVTGVMIYYAVKIGTWVWSL